MSTERLCDPEIAKHFCTRGRPPYPKDVCMTTTDWRNKLYFGDNLDVLRKHVADESVDLIYFYPTYNVLFQEGSGLRCH